LPPSHKVFGRFLQRLGIGVKQSIGGVSVTPAQAAAVGGKLQAALGPEGTQRLQAGVGTPSLPEYSPETLLPGSQPTTAQVAQTPGGTDLENALRNANPLPFDERAAQQNSARLAAINSVAPTGSPEAVGQFALQRLADIDRSGQEAVTAARQGVRARSNRTDCP
jgi:hypothetical protein